MTVWSGARRVRVAQRSLARLSPNARGIAAMLGAMAAFSIGDAMMKVSASHLPTGETLFVRGVMATAMIWLLALRTGVLGQVPALWQRHLPLRTLGDVGASIFFMSALAHMPLADAAAIMQTNPLAVTAGAALFLGEKVGWRRWTATGLGLLGVLLIIQPGSSTFTWASVLALLAVLSAASRDIVTRKMTNVPSVLITAVAATTTMLLSILFAPFEVWRMPAAQDIAVLAVAGACMLAGQILVVVSIRAGDMSAVVPFRYSAIVWTLLLSVVIWHYLPNALTLLGVAIVAGAGLYTFFREQALRRQGRMA